MEEQQQGERGQQIQWENGQTRTHVRTTRYGVELQRTGGNRVCPHFPSCPSFHHSQPWVVLEESVLHIENILGPRRGEVKLVFCLFVVLCSVPGRTLQLDRAVGNGTMWLRKRMVPCWDCRNIPKYSNIAKLTHSPLHINVWKSQHFSVHFLNPLNPDLPGLSDPPSWAPSRKIQPHRCMEDWIVAGKTAVRVQRVKVNAWRKINRLKK